MPSQKTLFLNPEEEEVLVQDLPLLIQAHTEQAGVAESDEERLQEERAASHLTMVLERINGQG